MAEPDATVLAYLVEAVATFRRGMPVASHAGRLGGQERIAHDRKNSFRNTSQHYGRCEISSARAAFCSTSMTVRPSFVISTVVEDLVDETGDRPSDGSSSIIIIAVDGARKIF